MPVFLRAFGLPEYRGPPGAGPSKKVCLGLVPPALVQDRQKSLSREAETGSAAAKREKGGAVKKGRIILCGGKISVLSIIYNDLVKELDIPLVLVEEKRPLPSRILQRIRRKRIRKVFGQVLFSRAVLPGLRRKAKPVREEIIKKYCLDTRQIHERAVMSVSSVNHPRRFGVSGEPVFQRSPFSGRR